MVFFFLNSDFYDELDYYDDIYDVTENTTKWLDSKEKFNGAKYGTMRIFYDNKTISMDIFEIPAVGDAKPVHYAYCSETPYPFELPSYSISKFKKVPEDLAK